MFGLLVNEFFSSRCFGVCLPIGGVHDMRALSERVWERAVLVEGLMQACLKASCKVF